MHRLAMMLCEKDEVLFEEVVSQIEGGLLAFCNKHTLNAQFTLSKGEDGRAWVVSPRSKRGGEKPSSPRREAVVLQPVFSPTQLYWDAFDPAHLLPYVPASRFVSWQSIMSLLPEACVKDMPKEQRVKNIVRCMRRYCDVVLTPQVMFRLRQAGLEHPSADPEGALHILQDCFVDEALLSETVRLIANAAAALKSVNDIKAFTLDELYLVDGLRPKLDALLLYAPSLQGAAGSQQKLLTRVCRMYPTVLVSFTRQGQRYFEALRSPPTVPLPPESSHRIRSLAALVRARLESPIQGDLQSLSVPCTVERFAQWVVNIGHTVFAEHEKGIGAVASVSELLSIGADILPINDEGLIDLSIGVPKKDPVASAGGGATALGGETRSKPPALWVRSQPASSRVGLMPEYRCADDNELDLFVTIDKKARWSTLRKSAKKKKKLLKEVEVHASTEQLPRTDSPSSALKSSLSRSASEAELIVNVIRDKCPTTEFIRLGAVSVVIPPSLMAMIPTSLLMFVDARPHDFEVVEEFTGCSTEYYLRVREIGEVPRSSGSRATAVAPGTFSDEELQAFVDHAVTGSSTGNIGSSIPNAWAKLPLSVRRQFCSQMSNFVSFLRKHERLYDVLTRPGIVQLKSKG